MGENHSVPRIAYVLGPFPLLSETFIINEILELKGQGIDVIIFSMAKPKESIIHPEAVELARETYYVNDNNKLRRILNLLYAHGYFIFKNPIRYLRVFWFVCGLDRQTFSVFLRVFYLALVLKKLKTEAVHTHFATYCAEYAMLISMITKVPYSFTIHAYDIFKKPRLIREKVEHARFVICISKFNKEFVKSNFFKENGKKIDEKINIIHCGVDLDRLLSLQVEGYENNGRSPFTIVSTGRLIEKKGHEYLIEACHILLKSGCSNFVCNIIGDGPLAGELYALVSRLGLKGKVNLLGGLSQDEVFYNLCKSDLFVLSCVKDSDGDMDGIPVSLMEAMALKKVVISTNISGIPELVKEGAGILVPPKDSEALAEAIRRIFYLDNKERVSMGVKGYEIVQREFDLKKNVSEIKNLFLSELQRQ